MSVNNHREVSATKDKNQITEAALRSALESVMIGGNHLALLIGPDHPSYEVEHDRARDFYYQTGRLPAYEAWCCWRTIMQARKVLEA